ncbi:MAG: hypothetical protein EA363_06370 [Balneolaceae bacterium]|nr:MAG: hypothetical protein EA363_06370 [Balneolaceae bacterium]
MSIILFSDDKIQELSGNKIPTYHIPVTTYQLPHTSYQLPHTENDYQKTVVSTEEIFYARPGSQELSRRKMGIKGKTGLSSKCGKRIASIFTYQAC